MATVSIRPLSAEDGETAAHIFFDAVHQGAAEFYSIEQRIAWAGSAPNPSGWQIRLCGVSGFAADIDGEMVGFMTLDSDGYIDLAFVRTDASGKGIGQRLYKMIEAQAIQNKTPKLTTHASKKAKPFFERMGWCVDQEQVVTRKGVSLTNFKMFKLLDPNS
ncbi:putative N-acetyltransferase YafP [Pseudovibrio axinellae]|uniref:Putative N-acetyltransferase YafP n=1 Tax=Pseudovibrio axinellae TaxID=989403 RepID=A0A161X7M3_9HYPH|nr:GNAT family N-acetyltransferase [Pseudovibrio axinellae]KZL05003.1 putative N-acetyltransferase YafP [Pseudovibrio axinellae]SER64423.1 Acetyltransferase, GNAT family [Pseudovibrio axinellae]